MRPIRVAAKAVIIRDGQLPGNGTSPDGCQVGVEWLDLTRLDAYCFYPNALKPWLASHAPAAAGEHTRPRQSIYLGDVN